MFGTIAVKDKNNFCLCDNLSPRLGAFVDVAKTTLTPLFPVSSFADQWPTEGKIDIHGLSVKYRSELDFALANVNVSIPARAKVQSENCQMCRKD